MKELNISSKLGLTSKLSIMGDHLFFGDTEIRHCDLRSMNFRNKVGIVITRSIFVLECRSKSSFSEGRKSERRS
jgi:hypothetical protein